MWDDGNLEGEVVDDVAHEEPVDEAAVIRDPQDAVNNGGDIVDNAPHGEPVVNVKDGTPVIEQVDACRRYGGIADDGQLLLSMTAQAHCSAPRRSREACTDAATDTLAVSRAWVAALEVAQDEATVYIFGDTHAPDGYRHCCVEVEG